VNAGFGQSFLEGDLDTGCGQGLIRGCFPVSAPSGSREEPVFMVMGFPELPEELQGTPGQRHIPVLVAFAANVEKHAVAVDIGNLQGPAFRQSQAAGIDCGQADAMAEHVDAGEGVDYNALLSLSRGSILTEVVLFWGLFLESIFLF